MSAEETKVEKKWETVTLKGEEIFTLKVDSMERPYDDTSSRAGQIYHIFRFRGAGGTCEPEFKKLLEQGEIDSVTLTEGEYTTKQPDPNNAGQMLVRKSWTIDAYTSNDQIKNFLSKQVEVVTKRAHLEAIKNGASIKVGADKLTSEINAAIAV